MKHFLLYVCVWTPGALAVVSFVYFILIARRVAAGNITAMDGYYAIYPWVWLPVFILIPAAILGVALLIKARWIALLQLGVSVGLVFAWIYFVESRPILQHLEGEK